MTTSQGLLSAASCFLLLSMPAYSSVHDEPTKSAASSKSEKEDQTNRKARKVYTNEDLDRLKTTPINQAPANQESREPKKSRKADGVEGYRDAHGHDRTYWQQKVRPLRRQLESLDSQIATLQAKQSKVTTMSGVKVSRSGRLHASSSDTRAQLTKQIDDLSAKKAEALRSIRDIEEDARKSQALPEWLR